jgi:streptogramin lyase
MAYGGGSLWVADANKSRSRSVTEVDPQGGARTPIRFDRHPTVLAWSDGYGDLWMDDFAGGSVSRMQADTHEVEKTYEHVAHNPGVLAVLDDAVWVGDWDIPQVVRLPALGPKRPRHIRLPVTTHAAGVTGIAAAGGRIWAAVPEDRALFRIDPRTNKATRIPFRYFPWGVAAGDDGVWVAVRAHNVPGD